MRIAIFSEVYWPMISGVSLTLQRTVEALEARGHSVRVYAPEYELPVGVPDLPHVHRSPARQFFLYPDVRWAFPVGAEVASDVARFRPDLIHVATEFAMGLTGARLARAFELPLVASAHTDYERYASRYRLDWCIGPGWHYLRWFYRQAAVVLCPSVTYQDHLRLRGIGHTTIWSRGVDLTAFSPAHRGSRFRESCLVSPGTKLVLYVGRLAAEKNVHHLLQAWDQLEGSHTDARLVLVGEGPLHHAIRDAQPRRVHLAGALRGPALGEAYASADCFAFPSSTETFGNVLLEAMASGLPSLAVSAGGVLDFARHDRNAWLVEPDDAAAIARGLALLLGDQARRARLAIEAVLTARAHDWDGVFDGLECDYAAVVSGKRQPVAA